MLRPVDMQDNLLKLQAGEKAQQADKQVADANHKNLAPEMSKLAEKAKKTALPGQKSEKSDADKRRKKKRRRSKTKTPATNAAGTASEEPKPTHLGMSFDTRC